MCLVNNHQTWGTHCSGMVFLREGYIVFKLTNVVELLFDIMVLVVPSVLADHTLWEEVLVNLARSQCVCSIHL